MHVWVDVRVVYEEIESRALANWVRKYRIYIQASDTLLDSGATRLLDRDVLEKVKGRSCLLKGGPGKGAGVPCDVVREYSNGYDGQRSSSLMAA